MPHFLSTAERVELVEILNSSASAAEAARIFNARHPERPHPVNRSTAIRLANKLHETGSLHDIQRPGRSSVLADVNQVDNILGRFRANKHETIRRAAYELNYSTKTVLKVLKTNRFRAYKFQKHQKLLPTDYEKRVNYCNAFIAQSQQDPDFTRNILWTDEKWYELNGSPNKQTFR